MSCRYIKPTVFGQKYTLEVRLIQLSKVRLVFQYQLFNHQYTMVHEGQTELIWLNHDLKPTNVYKTHPDIYERFLAEVTL
jgi:acyl-CoA thioester hydrolase